MQETVVFFDGLCTLCNSVVDKLLSWDKKGVLKFASLQEEKGQKVLKKQGYEPKIEPNSIILLHNGLVYEKSEAVFKMASLLPKPYSFIAFFQLFPLSLTNYVYDYIAKNRYRFWGQKNTCRIPTEEEQKRFL